MGGESVTTLPPWPPGDIETKTKTKLFNRFMDRGLEIWKNMEISTTLTAPGTVRTMCIFTLMQLQSELGWGCNRLERGTMNEMKNEHVYSSILYDTCFRIERNSCNMYQPHVQDKFGNVELPFKRLCLSKGPFCAKESYDSNSSFVVINPHISIFKKLLKF